MASYEEIQKFLREKYGYNAKAYAIAHAKEAYGIPTKKAPNRKGERKWKCPEKRLPQMKEAFQHFGML